MTELRSAVNVVRSAAGLAPAVFTDATLTGVVPKAVHILEMRSALLAARSALGLPSMTFFREPVALRDAMLVREIIELRGGVQ